MKIDVKEPSLLLEKDEAPPVNIDRVEGTSPFLIVCDHAGREIPKRLGTLGLPDSELIRHIAWDIGAGDVSRRVSDLLDATCIRQVYSRLVVDCNRSPGHPQSIALLSEETEIPGNLGLTSPEVDARLDEIFWPYHQSISKSLDFREATGRSSVLIAIHSFTPIYMSVPRPWDIGVLHGANPDFALLVKDCLIAEGLIVGDNEPYQLSEESDYTIPYHAGRRGLPYIELEIRQDLIAQVSDQQKWAKTLQRVLTLAYSRLVALKENSCRGH